MKKLLFILLAFELLLMLSLPLCFAGERFEDEMPYFVICPFCYANSENLKFRDSNNDREWYCKDSDYVFTQEQNKIINSAIHRKVNIDCYWVDYIKELEQRIEKLEEKDEKHEVWFNDDGITYTIDKYSVNHK